MIEVIVYMRVLPSRIASSNEANAERFSRLETFASANGLRIVHVVSDAQPLVGLRHAIVNRPKFQEAMRTAWSKGIPILIESLNQLTRNAQALERLLQTHPCHLLIASSAGGSQYISMQSQRFGESSRLRLAESNRIFSSELTDLQRAQFLGREQVKTKASKRVQALAEIYRQCLEQGKGSAEEVAQVLNDKGLKTARGLEWTAERVRHMFQKMKGFRSL